MEDEKGEGYGMPGTEDKSIQSFDWKSLKEDTAWKTYV
jgi:hypothetical protein